MPEDARPIVVRAFSPAAIVIVGMFAALWTALLVTGPVDWDLGWQMYVAERLLHGARLYVDIGATEQHPPLLTWLCAALTAVANVLHVNPIRFYIAFICVSSAACSVWATRIISSPHGDGLSPSPAGGIFATFILGSLAMYGFASGGGEQMAVAFALPYLMAAAHDRPRSSLAIGILAGFGFAMKPHYALVWLCVEACVAFKQRTWKSFLRPTSIAVVGVWIVYIIATLFITPAYFHAAANAAMYYNAFMTGSLAKMIASAPTMWLIIAAMSAYAARNANYDVRASIMLLIAALAMWIGALVQMKGWPHHLLPASACALTSIAMTAVIVAASRAQKRGLGIALVIAAVLAYGTYRVQHDRTLLAHAQVNAPTFLTGLGDVVKRFAPEGPVLMLSYSLSAAFPMINETGAEWTLPESSLWMVSGLYPDQWKRGGPFNYRAPSQWLPFERDVHDLVWNGVEHRRPKIVIIEAHTESGFDFRAFAETDPRMRAFLSGWTKAGSVGPFDILLPTPPAVAGRTRGPVDATCVLGYIRCLGLVAQR